MHPYSIDTDERRKVLIGIFIVSIILYEAFNNILSYFTGFQNLSFSISLVIQLPSAYGIFSGLYYVFDNYGWKCKLFRTNLYIKEPIIQTPILEGKWKGEYYSKRNCPETNRIIEKEGETSFRIEQTWTKIRIVQDSETSKSCSEAANLSINDKMGIVLRYQYLNESNAKGEETMNSHIGFNKLIFEPENEILEGDYFTDKNRQTYGYLKYQRCVEEVVEAKS